MSRATAPADVATATINIPTRDEESHNRVAPVRDISVRDSVTEVPHEGVGAHDVDEPNTGEGDDGQAVNGETDR